MKYLIWIAILFLFSLSLSCNEDENPDPVADPECAGLIAEIYTECDLTLPPIEAEYFDADAAEWKCMENEDYDWACIDDCVFDNKKLCVSLQLCLDDCD